MKHPFESIPTSKLKALFWFLLVATLLTMVIMNLVGAPLMTVDAPSGIVSYELAGSVTKTQAILNSWNQNALLHAAFSLGLDYLFMVVYAAAISLACVWAAEGIKNRRWPLGGLGAPLAWGVWLAGLLDAVENLGLTLILFGSALYPWTAIARWCAIFKFALIFFGLVYALYGLVVGIVSRLARAG